MNTAISRKKLTQKLSFRILFNKENYFPRVFLISSSECSASCGGTGTRENTFQCIQTFSNNSRSIIDSSYCADFKNQKFESCEGDGCWQYSEWSEVIN